MPRKIFIKQHDITDCGAACLATVAWYHGLKIPISQIRHYAKTDRKGTTILGMVHAAKQLGFEAQGVRCQNGVIPKDLLLPAIAHICTNSGAYHFIVIFELHKKHIEISDPAKGRTKISIADFLGQWTGVLILLTPNEFFLPGDQRELHWTKLFGLITSSPMILIECVVATFIGTLLNLLSALYIQYVIDDVYPNNNAALLNILSLGMLGIIVFKMILGYIRQFLLLYIAQRIDVSLILGYYRHILQLPQSFFDTRRVGEIISRIDDAGKIRNAISIAPLSIIVDGSILVFSVAIMSFYSSKLALLALAFLSCSVIVFHCFASPIRRIQRTIMEKSAELHSVLVASLTAASTIKIFSAEPYYQEKTESIFINILQLIRKSSLLGMGINISNAFIFGISSTLILWMGSHIAMSQMMSLGNLMSFFTLFSFMTTAATNLMGIYQQMQEALIATDRLFEALKIPTEFQESNRQMYLLPNEKYTICFDNVSFSYGARGNVLNGVSFQLRPGTMTAIVGESGSGKTTIAKLLQGLYSPKQGEIYLGQLNIKDVVLGDLRTYSSGVPQDVDIFHGSVFENIAFGELEPDHQKILEISINLGIDSFVNKLPDRWNTILGDRGADLSGGQRQRIAIARALYRNPKLLILDEATSALDSESEYAIQRALVTLRQQGLTTLVIAHRLSTVMNADQIIVMQDGSIAERGTHDELLKREGLYYSLWMRQIYGADAESARNNHDTQKLQPALP